MILSNMGAGMASSFLGSVYFLLGSALSLHSDQLARLPAATVLHSSSGCTVSH